MAYKSKTLGKDNNGVVIQVTYELWVSHYPDLFDDKVNGDIFLIK